jgi:hypothetical protein
MSALAIGRESKSRPVREARLSLLATLRDTSRKGVEAFHPGRAASSRPPTLALHKALAAARTTAC